MATRPQSAMRQGIIRIFEKMEIRKRLLALTGLSAEYCATIENSPEMELQEFVVAMLRYLPRIYVEFNEIDAGEESGEDEWDGNLDFGGGMSDHLDEEMYESLRRQLEQLLGEEDTYLETFEENMKYSDTPIACSISENLCDIYQPLYNFAVEVRDSEGSNLEEAFRECQESFREYWSRTLCNVMRALNSLKN